MPAYNVAKYITKAINSVLAQTFTDFELLIINDGSTDDTEKIVRSFSDDRIRLINQTNQGVAAALNIGMLNARADLVARFDADDICLPERLMVQYNFLNDNPEYIIVGSDADYIDMNEEYVFTYSMPAHTNNEIQELPVNKCPFIHSAVLFRKKFILQAGGYNIEACAFEDHILWAKSIRLGKTCNLQQVLLQVRLNPESISIDEKWRTKRFREIKSQSISRGSLTMQEGIELSGILKKQNNPKIKEGSYYSLLGKKYLWNNHQPQKARINLRKAIRINPGRIDSYFILALSFFPKDFISWIYKKKLNSI
ncbi:MAG: glycosyltransferase [Chitinophagaceae bacterium]|nr:glycosyltransferase [Chitinophagaceae bacterium]